MAETVVTEAQISERLGIRLFEPIVVPGRTAQVNLRRFKMGNAVFLNRTDVVKLLRTESQSLGGDQVLDRLADLIMEVTT